MRFYKGEKRKRNHVGTKTTIAHLNIQGLEARISSLEGILNGQNPDLDKETIDILALSETWENEDSRLKQNIINGYEWFGKPHPQIRKGVGFLIKKKTFQNVDICPIIMDNENILWIQRITKSTTYYYAAVYIPYGDKKAAKEVFETLTLNVEELKKTGVPVILGDLNAWVPELTGDPGRETNPNGILLTDLLNHQRMSVITSDSLIKRDLHWTFTSPNGHRSITDYILVPLTVTKYFSDYRVYWSLNCGSYHAMQIVSENNTTNPEQWEWGNPEHNSIDWTEEARTRYLDAFEDQRTEGPTPLDKQEVNEATVNIINSIDKARETLHEFKRKKSGVQRTRDKFSKEIRTLEKEKKMN